MPYKNHSDHLASCRAYSLKHRNEIKLQKAGKKDEIKRNRHNWHVANKTNQNIRAREYGKANRERISKRQAEYRLSIRDILRDKNKAWALANPEKVRLKCQRQRSKRMSASGYNYTTSQHIKWRWEMWGNRCWICGDAATTTDHVKPITKGGAHFPCNLRPACKSCNSRKGSKWIGFAFNDRSVARHHLNALAAVYEGKERRN